MFKFISIILYLLHLKLTLCDEVSNNYFVNRFKKQNHNSCGMSRKGEGLIIGGSYFEKGSYPWMAALMDDKQLIPEYFCGGVLISNTKVLSAAHCIFPKHGHRKLPRDVVILLGAHNIHKSIELDRVAKIPKQIFIHSDWNPKVKTYDADISVLLLEEVIHFTSAIQPICLWTSSVDLTINNGVVIGYGKSESERNHEIFPKQLKTSIVSNEDCFLEEPDFAKISSKRTFCAGSINGTGGPCFGDSGHGLFVKKGSTFFLRGIVAASFLDGSMCDTSKYALYTNVLKYTNWIENPSEGYQILPQDTIQESSTTELSTTPSPELPLSLQSSKLERKIQIDDSFCGVMSISAGLIHGGELSNQNQFPWMAIIKYKNNNGDWVHQGSGSLISSKHVVARSLSTSNKDELNNWIPVDLGRIKVLLGTTIFDDLSESGSLEVGIAKTVNLPNSREVSSTLDINVASIVTLDREIAFTEFIRPVCLWPFGDDLNDIIGRDAFAVGYGVDDTGKYSFTRKHVRMTVTGIDDACKLIYDEELAFQNETKMFCIKGNGNETPCNFDDQLYMKVESKWYLKGLFNYFSKKCSTKKPVLCEDIAPFVPWIQNQTKTTATTIVTAITQRPQLQRKIHTDDSFCGVMSISAGLIHGGEFSARNQFPWMAIIKLKNSGVWSHFGSGSLISSKHVIAKSLSVSYADDLNNWISVEIDRVKVLLGTTKYDELNESESLEINVSKIVNHRHSRRVMQLLDINAFSILTLDREIAFTEFIRPICLWPFGDDLSDIAGSDAYAVGYGRDHTGNHSLTRKHIRMTVTGIDKTCKNTFDEELAFKNETKLFCIKGSENETPCFYDDQLYMKVESKWYLKGTLNLFYHFDDGTCSTKKPVLCEDIFQFIPWIQNQTLITAKTIVTTTTQRPQLQRKIHIDDSFCGVMSISAGLIQGGEFSARNQFPWLAIMKLKNSGVWSHFGSGSLISSKHVIVKSSSVSYKDDLNDWIAVEMDRVKVFLGTTKYDDLNESGSLEVGIVKIVNHPKSRKVIPSLDINVASVITLDREIAFNEFIRPVCLWPFGDELSDIVNRNAYAVGYGRDHTGNHSLTRKHVRMTVTENDESCKNNFDKELAFQNETKMFCIKGNDNETPCFYDNQLYMKVESRWYLKGLLNVFFYFDDNTCSTKKPVLCEDIGQFIPWIQNQII